MNLIKAINKFNTRSNHAQLTFDARENQRVDLILYHNNDYINIGINLSQETALKMIHAMTNLCYFVNKYGDK